jgi:hypothetical protein
MTTHKSDCRKLCWTLDWPCTCGAENRDDERCAAVIDGKACGWSQDSLVHASETRGYRINLSDHPDPVICHAFVPPTDPPAAEERTDSAEGCDRCGWKLCQCEADPPPECPACGPHPCHCIPPLPTSDGVIASIGPDEVAPLERGHSEKEDVCHCRACMDSRDKLRAALVAAEARARTS